MGVCNRLRSIRSIRALRCAAAANRGLAVPQGMEIIEELLSVCEPVRRGAALGVIMRTPVPEKLLKLVDDIAAEGDAPLTRLTVLKKWFEERPGRLPAFGAWVARRAASRKGKTRGEAGALFDAARALLRNAGKVRPDGTVPIDRPAATALRDRLYAFQSQY